MNKPFKDEAGLNRKSEYEIFAKELWNRFSKEVIDETFWKYVEEKADYDKDLKRFNCGSFEKITTNNKEYEKRICKCLYYFNDDSSKKACEACVERDNPHFGMKITGDIRVVSYEVVPIKGGAGIGNIDLLLCDDRYYYITEVKPPRSDETLLRMVAEIMTYGKSLELNKSVKKCGELPVRKAICFWAGSEQEKEFFDEDYENFGKYTKKLIELFGISVFRVVEDSTEKTATFEVIG